MHSIRIIGPGRAGTSLAAALSARGWAFAGFLGRHDDLSGAARGVDVLVVATPDDAIAEVAAIVDPVDTTTVVHLSGSLGLDALAPHPRRAAVHPLVPLPNGEVGAARLASGVSFAVAGAPVAREMVDCLGGRTVEVADEDRAAYHATACMAANHVVALLGQVERVAASVGLDLESFLPLTRAAVDDVAALGASAALTGPARRGDWATLSRHLDALPESERAGYQAGAALATRLAQAGEPATPHTDRAERNLEHPDDARVGHDGPRRCAGRRSCRRPSRTGGSRKRPPPWMSSSLQPPAARSSMRPAPPTRPSGSCRPWARSTPATCLCSSGPVPSAGSSP